jgi:hypothetical protein
MSAIITVSSIHRVVKEIVIVISKAMLGLLSEIKPDHKFRTRLLVPIAYGSVYATDDDSVV